MRTLSHILFAVLILHTFPLVASRPPTPVASTITSVTVYLSGAQITRTATVQLQKGSQSIVLKELSEEADPASIQVSGTGNFTILSVKHRVDHGTRPESEPQIKELEAGITALEQALEEQQIGIGILQNEEQRLQKNETIEAGERGMTLEQLRSINDYLRERISLVRNGVLERQRRMKGMREEVQQITLQIGQLRSKAPKAQSEILVELDVPVPVNSTITLRYVVRTAGWTPQYDIRVGALSAPLQLIYKAGVHQSTGEDWNNVELELSSGDPQREGVMPLMAVWRLDAGTRPPVAMEAPRPYNASVREVRGIVRDANTGEPLPFVNIQVLSADGTTLNGAASNFDGYYAVAIPPGGRMLTFSFVGYQAQQKDIHDSAMNVALEQAVELAEFEVVQYSVPLIDRDGGASGGTVRKDEITRIQGLTAASIAKDPSRSTARGSRSENDHYYVDGIKVSSGGIPADYGDVSGGLLHTPETTVRQRNTQFVLEISLPYTIPADGQGHVVAVKEHEVASAYRHYCIPKLDPAAYLFAKATGWDELDLLSGPANLYYEGTFIGETFLDSDQVTDTLDISLGRDRSIVVQRIRSKELSQQQFFGNKRSETIGWHIDVRNTKAEPIDLVIIDQIPVSVRNDIEVTLREHDASSINDEKGFLTWRKSIDPRSVSRHGFVYAVKAPRQLPLILE